MYLSIVLAIWQKDHILRSLGREDGRWLEQGTNRNFKKYFFGLEDTHLKNNRPWLENLEKKKLVDD